MLAEHPTLINVRPSGRWSALHQAAAVPSHFIDVILRVSSNRIASFHCHCPRPAQANVKEVVEFLLHARADANLRNSAGRFAQDCRGRAI